MSFFGFDTFIPNDVEIADTEALLKESETIDDLNDETFGVQTSSIGKDFDFTRNNLPKEEIEYNLSQKALPKELIEEIWAPPELPEPSLKAAPLPPKKVFSLEEIEKKLLSTQIKGPSDSVKFERRKIRIQKEQEMVSIQ